MNIRIVKNRYINALLLLMLFSAIAHVLILLYMAITSGSLHFLNYFTILEIGYILPGFSNIFSSDVISFVFAGAMYIIILRINR